MLRRILGIVLGIIAGIAVIGGVEWLGHKIYPPPPDLDMNKPEALESYMHTAPIMALLFVPLAWALGSFAAGLVSTLVGKDDSKGRSAVICGCILLFLGVINLASFSHPIWFWPLAAFVFIPFAWLGFRVARKKA